MDRLNSITFIKTPKTLKLLSILETNIFQILTIMMITDESSPLLNMDLAYECKSRYIATCTPTLEQTTVEKCMKLILVTGKVSFCTLKQRFSLFSQYIHFKI